MGDQCVHVRAVLTTPRYGKELLCFSFQGHMKNSYLLSFLASMPQIRRSQVFGFIRQEFARATAMTGSTKPPPQNEGSSCSPEGVPGSGDGSENGPGGAEVELLEKRNIVLAELPRLMELNKVCDLLALSDGDFWRLGWIRC